MEQFSPRVRRFSKFWEPLVGLAALATIPLLFAEGQLDRMTALLANAIIWAIFTAEFVSTVAVCSGKKERRAYVRSSLLDILIILGSFPILPSTLQSLRVLRLGRAARLVRMLRLGRVLALGWVLRWAKQRFKLNPLIFSGTSTLIAIFIGANAFHILEPNVAPGLDHALWWAFATCSTVGYGDLTPVSGAGRIVGICMMIVGVATMAAFSGSLASYLVHQDEKREGDKLELILVELKELRQQVARLEEIGSSKSEE